MHLSRRLLAAARPPNSIARVLTEKSQQEIPANHPTKYYDEPQDIAILGGGITGLASAYFASTSYPNAKITLYEKSDRLGGWIKSSRHNVNGGTVIFEHGPRSLKPNALTLGVIEELGLGNDLLITPRTAPAARNRFVWYDGRLVNVQQGLMSALREPLLQSALKNMAYTFNKVCPIYTDKDETIAEFMHRRGCDDIANNLLSALIHGIYAGDIEKLSMRSVMPSIVYNENAYLKPSDWLLAQLRSYFVSDQPKLGNLLRSAIEAIYLDSIIDGSQLNIKQALRMRKALHSSVYTLRGGLETLITRLIAYLERSPNVKIITNTDIQQISTKTLRGLVLSGGKVELRYTTKSLGRQSVKTNIVDAVISTIPSMSLAKLVSPLSRILAEAPASTVCVVNLWYDQPGLLSQQGFGFLMPRTIPVSKNPEGALGVVFDSDATPDLDTVPGTKLTVMLGGAFWSGFSRSHLPSNSEAIEMAKAVVAAHLNITRSPILTHAELHMDCIPQYHSGHYDRMRECADKMADGRWGNIKVAGSWYNGIGVNDCIISAALTAYSLTKAAFGVEFINKPYHWYRESEVPHF